MGVDIQCCRYRAMAQTLPDYLWVYPFRGIVTIQHLKARLKLSCTSCGQQLGRSHTFCPECGSKVEKAQVEQQQHRRQRVLPIDQDTMKMLKEYIDRRRTFFCADVTTNDAGWNPIQPCASSLPFYPGVAANMARFRFKPLS